MSDQPVSEVVAGKTGFITDVNQYFNALKEDFFPRNSAGVVTNAGGSLGDSTRGWLKGFFTSKQPFEFGGIPNGGTPSGVMMPYTASATVSPYGWFFAYGDTIGDIGSGADHEGADFEHLFDMYKLISAYGNSGAEVFASGDVVSTPDMRGRHVRALDESKGIDYQPTRAIGSTQASQVEGHRHQVIAEAAAEGPRPVVRTTGAGGTLSGPRLDLTESTASHNYLYSSEYGGGSETTVANMAFPYIIKI